MIIIGLVAVLVLSLIVLAAVTEIKGAPSSADIAAQCTPSRPQLLTFQERPARQLRWFGLERNIGQDAEIKKDKLQ